jgi:hypothetical protein
LDGQEEAPYVVLRTYPERSFNAEAAGTAERTPRRIGPDRGGWAGRSAVE